MEEKKDQSQSHLKMIGDDGWEKQDKPPLIRKGHC